MRTPRLQNGADQLLPADLPADALAEQLHMPGAEAAETHRFMVEGSDVIFDPHDVGMGLRVDGPQLPGMLPPYRRKETGAMMRLGTVISYHAFQPRQTVAIIPAAVGMAGGDPRIQRIDDPQLLQPPADLEEFLLIRGGPFQRRMPVRKLLRVDLHDHFIDFKLRGQPAELFQGLLKSPGRQCAAQRVPRLIRQGRIQHDKMLSKFNFYYFSVESPNAGSVQTEFPRQFEAVCFSREILYSILFIFQLHPAGGTAILSRKNGNPGRLPARRQNRRSDRPTGTFPEPARRKQKPPGESPGKSPK